MPVFVVSPECIDQRTISVTGDVLVHIRDSLRITVGETLWLGNGQDARYRVEITEVSKRAVTARILETIQEPPRRTPRLILGQSLLKGEKMDWVIQKATELGVSEIVPIESRHSVVQLKADRVDHQLARWQRIALEAAQQSEQWRIPTIAMPHSLSALLSSRATDALTLMLAERQEGISLQSVELPHDMNGSLRILIGPEGGWSQEEVQITEQAGVVSITLGQQILRSETAAIATISILQSRLGALS
ncbi:16S rRNA (uracil(1498)-N(3))-methyltransferase [Candidatus Nitrospira nitrificans]|uniref:Ribosomal RNA small subunit methyltransferase E n=1 Tax=Candidatus Nitrospira nitrificans TaxID=1742973 RepID=A0A0S4LQG5_9BACT|nr:16S rRNA (uracil(1498)-N(3))-methyltransferase [Candidatus Nitrospira nitrificans]CUS38941.1 Ribosomal RNA small subunit methyltransferase E [Candidatus Nitrospira nitrificans]